MNVSPFSAVLRTGSVFFKARPQVHTYNMIGTGPMGLKKYLTVCTVSEAEAVRLMTNRYPNYNFTEVTETSY